MYYLYVITYRKVTKYLYFFSAFTTYEIITFCAFNEYNGMFFGFTLTFLGFDVWFIIVFKNFQQHIEYFHDVFLIQPLRSTSLNYV